MVSVLQRFRNIGFEKYQKILTKISANVGLQRYYRVYVISYFVDFVPCEYKTMSTVSHKYLESTNFCEIDILKVSALN